MERGETLFSVLFLERRVFCQANAKWGKEEGEDNRRKKRNCILGKEMRK